MNCPTCNRTSDDARFIGDFCEFCAADALKKKIPESVEIEQCRLCGRIRLSGAYYIMDKNALAAAIGSRLKLRDWAAKVKDHKDRQVLVLFSYRDTKPLISFEKVMRLRIVHKTCQDDYRRSSGYYEAIVQFRGSPERVDAELERITRHIEENGAFISKVERGERGCDIYLSSKALAEGFFSKRKLKPKKSFQLYSIREGKKLYRNTYFVRV